MTLDERLKIAEELANGWVPLQFVIDSFTVEYHEGNWQAYRGSLLDEATPLWKRHSPLTPSCIDKIECIHIARQILKAERESRKSEREKRLETALQEIVNNYPSPFLNVMGLFDRAKEALKETP